MPHYTITLKFIGWKTAELVLFCVAFPFLFIGSWGVDFSDWCHDRAIKHDPRGAE